MSQNTKIFKEMIPTLTRRDKEREGEIREKERESERESERV